MATTSNIKRAKYSRYWLPKTSNLNKALELVSLTKTVNNFVRIQTGLNIKCTVKGADSFTDGSQITISANTEDLDTTVGLSLHEASHIKWTDFTNLAYFEFIKGRIVSFDSCFDRNRFEAYFSIPEELEGKAHKKNVPMEYRDSKKYYEKIVEIVYDKSKNTFDYNVAKNINNIVKDLTNWVEDRRIDKLAFTSSPGYAGYYDALYSEYFYSDMISKGLNSTEYRTEDVSSYMFRIINILNENSDLNALKGLKRIYEIIDIDNILRLNSVWDSFDVATEITMEILKYVKNTSSKENKSSGNNGDGQSSSNNGDGQSSGNDSDGQSDSNNSDSLKKLSNKEKKELEDLISKELELIDNDVQKEKIDESIARSLNSVAAGKIDEKKSNFENKDVKVLVIKNFDKNFINQAQVDFNEVVHTVEKYELKEAVLEGLKYGTLLGNKLKIRNDIKTKTKVRKEYGKIDKRLLSEAGFGNKKIFKNTKTFIYDDASLHISIDASGSMRGEPFNKSMKMAASICKAASMIDGLDVVVSIRSTTSTAGSYASQTPFIMFIYDSKVDPISKITNTWGYVKSNGATPEGLCYDTILEELKIESKNKNCYLVNLSDGCPGAGALSSVTYTDANISYYGDEAVEHTAKVVKKIERAGIKVLSYFLDNGWDDGDNTVSNQFKKMYGNNARFIDIDSIPQIANTLNKKFLEV